MQIQTIQPKIDLASWIVIGGSLLALISLFISNPEFNRKELWFMIEILILTAVTRSVSLRFGLGLYAQGIGFSAIGILLFWEFLRFFNLNDGATAEVIIATSEEIFKIAPVILAWYLAVHRKKLHFTISDWLFLAVFCGAGFSMLEKHFWEGITFPFTYGPHLGSIYFFPDALGNYMTTGGEFGYIGHAAASGLIGMAIGLGLYFRGKAKTWWWTVPAIAFSWVTLEHIFNNLYYETGTEALLGLGGGKLTPWLFLILLIVSLAIDFRNTRIYWKKHTVFYNQLLDLWVKIKADLQATRFPTFTIIITWLKYLRLSNVLGWEASLDTTLKTNLKNSVTPKRH